MEKHRVSCICYLSKTHFVRDFLQISIGNSSSSTTCNPIYIAGTILANHNGIPSATHPPAPLAIPFTLRKRSYSCKSQWNSIGNSSSSTTCNPIYIAGTILANHNGIPSATHPPAPLAIPFTLRKRSYSCKSQWNSIGNSSTSTTCNPIYIAGTILQLQITMEFCRPRVHEKQLKPHLQCGTDPTMIRG